MHATIKSQGFHSMRIPVLIFFLLCLAGRAAFAQSWELGGGIGSSGYMGDLNQANVFKFTDFAYGGFFKRNFNGYLSARLSLWHGRLQGNDADSKNEQFRNRNINFITPINEVALTGEWNVFHYQADAGKKVWTPYLFAGVGIVNYYPRTRFNGEEIPLRNRFTEGQTSAYKANVLTVPYGAGVKYNIGGHWNLNAEIGYRTAMTDYLDDVSGFYPANPATWTVNGKTINLSDPSVNGIGEVNTQRGDQRNRDSYMFVGFTVSYTFVTQKCYNF